MKYDKEIDEIRKAIVEEIDLEFYDRKDSVNQFCVSIISGNPVPEDHLLLVSFDKRTLGIPPMLGTFRSTGVSQEYYGKVTVYYCKKKRGLFGKETIKVDNFYKKIYSKEDWNSHIEKIHLADIVWK